MNELIGKKVVVYSETPGGERQDIGVLEGVDGVWVRIKKADNELLFFCLYHVRLVKPFDVV